MRKLLTGLGAASLAAGLLLGSSALALADTDTETGPDNHSTCSAQHSLNVLNCALQDALGLGPVHIF